MRLLALVASCLPLRLAASQPRAGSGRQRQRLQLVRLHRRGPAQGSSPRTPASRSTTRPTTATRSSTPSCGPAGRATTSWCPRPRPSSCASSPANLYLPLDKSKLKNWNNLDPEIMAALAKYDPGNAHGVPWMWGTTGIGYNVAEIRKRMPDAPVDSLRMIFDPAVVSKFKDCGVMLLDSATDVLPAALKYLGLDPDSKKPEDLAKAADVVKAVRPYRPQVPFVGVHQRAGRREHLPRLRFLRRHLPGARSRRQGHATSVDIEYAIPREGSLLWIDVVGHSQGRAQPGQRLPLPRLHAGGQGRRRLERTHRLRQRQQGGLRAAAQGHLRRIR